ncbi:MAG: acyl-CoA dehydrogenase family protein, partial [Comamonadaceae bacterium]
MQYTHEHLEIQKTMRRFIDDEINPHVDEWEAAEAFPAHEVFKRMGALGLLGLNKPEAYGGASSSGSRGARACTAWGVSGVLFVSRSVRLRGPGKRGGR